MAPKAEPENKDNKLSAVESALYKAAADSDVLYQEDAIAACPGFTATELQNAVNLLLRKSLLKLMKDNKGKACFKAVNAKDARLLGALASDESLVYTYVQNAGEDGIWIKALKAKTNLHITVLNRVLKQLEHRQLVKNVKNVKFPTRKTYMLFNLKPSVELTGGPWFSDNELDVGFIETLCQAVYGFLMRKTFLGESSQVLPASKADQYPSLLDILDFIKKNRLTDVDLQEEHVQSLVDVLIFDGKAEWLPGGGGGGFLQWDADEDAEEEANAPTSRSKSKSQSKKRGRIDEDEEHGRQKKRKKQVNEAELDEEAGDRKRKRASPAAESTKSVKRNRVASPSRSQSPSASEASSRSPSPVTFTAASPVPMGNGLVYRAVKREQISLGFTQVPCGNCDVFDFCKPNGPVNARDCEYYSGWLEGKDEERRREITVRKEEKGKARESEQEDEDEDEDEEGGHVTIEYEEEVVEEYD